MSFQTAKYVYPFIRRGLIFPFTGGLVDNTPPSLMIISQTPYARNFRLDGKSIIIRPGHKTHATLDGTDYPRGITSYLRANSANDCLISRVNADATHKLAKVTEAGVVTNILTNSDITSDNRMSFVNVGDDLYCMNGTDFGKLNGTTYTPITMQATLTKATISFVNVTPALINDSGSNFLARGFSAGQVITISGSASNNKTVTIASATDDTLTLIATDTLVNESAGASDTITGVKVYPSFGVYFGGCLWVGGFTAPGYSNQVYKSPTNSPSTFTTGGASGSGVFTFPENVTGICATAQAVFVFTKNTIHVADIGSQVQTAGVITFSFRALQTTEGATNNQCICAVGASVYYLSPANSINMIARGANIYGFEIQNISQRAYAGINNLTDSLDNDQSLGFAQNLPGQNLIKWFLKTNGATINDICIIYDQVRNQFLCDTSKYFFDETVLHNKVYAVSCVTPTVFLDETGNDDDGGAIPFEYCTKPFDEGVDTSKKVYWESRLSCDITELAELTQEIYLDAYVDYLGIINGTLVDTKTIDKTNIKNLGVGGTGTMPIATFAIGVESPSTQTIFPIDFIRQKGNLNVRGKTILFRYTCNVVGANVRLRRLGYKMEILDNLTTNLT